MRFGAKNRRCVAVVASIGVFVGLLYAVGVPHEHGYGFLENTKILSTVINGERKTRVYAFEQPLGEMAKQIEREHGKPHLHQLGSARYSGNGWTVVIEQNPYRDGRPNRLILYTGVSWQDKTARWVSESIFRPLGLKRIL